VTPSLFVLNLAGLKKVLACVNCHVIES